MNELRLLNRSDIWDEMAKHHKTPKGLPKPKKPRAIDEWRAAFKAFFERKKMRTGKKWGNL